MDAIHVGDVGMAASSDDGILQLARTQDRIVVTLDADFHALLALSDSRKPSVIRIREEGLKGPALCQLILKIWGQFSEPLTQGCVLSATLSQVRLRSLPIHS